jgi:hypothetical protein
LGWLGKLISRKIFAWGLGCSKCYTNIDILDPFYASQEVAIGPLLDAGQASGDMNILMSETEPVWLLELTDFQLQTLLQQRQRLHSQMCGALAWDPCSFLSHVQSFLNSMHESFELSMTS